MLINEIRISNIKGFGQDDQSVLLNFAQHDGGLPKWIVVAGRNGAGKTTFLQTIALAVAGPSAARTLRETYSDWIRRDCEEASALVQLKFSDSDGFGRGRKPTFNPWVGLRWTKQPDGPEPSIERAKRGGGWDPLRGPWYENPQGWFLCGYGPFRRLSVAPVEVQRMMMTPGRPSSLASLFQEGASLSEAILWLQQIYLRRLEGAPDAARIENIILRLLDDGLLPEGMKVSHVNSDGLWVTTPTGVKLPLRALSDGYRTVAALVLDIVRQVYTTDKDVKLVEGSTHVAFKHEGVVLIDEIDVHLHVSWQQRIGFWLKRHFPNMQFVVSTHSPFICQAADERGLVRLAAPGEIGTTEILEGERFNRVVNGSADDAILTDLFGLESPYSGPSQEIRKATAVLEHVAQSGDLSEEDKNRLHELQAKLPKTPSTDVVDAIRQLTSSLEDAED